MADESIEKKRSSVSPEEMAVAFSGPAPMVNKFYVTLSGATARIAFAEGNPGISIPQFRSAVSMTTSDLVELRDLLERLLKRARTTEVDTSDKAGTH